MEVRQAPLQILVSKKREKICIEGIFHPDWYTGNLVASQIADLGVVSLIL